MKQQYSFNSNLLLHAYRLLLLIRNVELAIENVYHLDEMKTPIHLCLGQEAADVSVCAHLEKTDMIFSNHRGHGHYLAKGGDLKRLIAELYCRKTGCSSGRGGSMHLMDKAVGHFGSSAIVGGGIPHAVGAALAFKMKKQKSVAVTFFGDAATEEGVFYESMNLAMLKKVPVLFVCENNRYSVCSPLKVRQSNDKIIDRAKAFNMPSASVDGMSFFKMWEAAQKAVAFVRQKNEPFLLECQVERLRAHAGSGDPLVEKYRLPEDLKTLGKRDPLKELELYLLQEKKLTPSRIGRMRGGVNQEIMEAFEFAKKSSLPDGKEVEKWVFV